MVAKKDIKAETTEVVEEIIEDAVVTEPEASAPEEDAKIAKKTPLKKAGKQSAKAVREAEELESKEARKEATSQQEDVPKPKAKPRIKVYSKKQKAARELVDKTKLYSVAEAVELMPKLSHVAFDASVELHIALSIDPRQADQQFRMGVVLPAGTGKAVRVAVLAEPKLASACAAAGADLTDSEQILADIAKGKFDFDILVATPAQMAALGRFAKTLGPKGLMPSPKSGTVSPDPAKAVAEIKKGRLDLKNDANGIIHIGFGKVSFKPADLAANAQTVIDAVLHNRPSGVKGIYVKSVYMSATMSPSVKIDTAISAPDKK